MPHTCASTVTGVGVDVAAAGNYCTVPHTCASTVKGVGVDVAAAGTMETGWWALFTLV